MTPPDDALLVLRDVHVTRGEAHVLQGVSFTVRPNRVTALLGRNGVGKTTTMLSVLGLVPATGSVLMDGAELLGRPTHRRVRQGIGYVPEDREVFAELTVEENLELAARTPEAAQRRASVYDLFPDLLRRARQRAGSLSGGQQQMVAIARAMLNPNRLLLVDEPSKGLAPIVVGHVVEALERAAQETTVLLVDQNIRVAERLATDAVILDHGTVVFAGPMADVVADEELTRTYLGVAGAVAETPADQPEVTSR
ncbi:ABC transporter ATP-binding protein [Pseudonocardia ailaonensis]|uniref:ABC transporter ATP-binding protein n=1 Tax=Pseudonocardia ailaonensis TaxID=367279 RepID=A0ABN2N3I4_9PSEU